MTDSEKLKAVSNYLFKVQSILKTGDAREHAYRPAFQELIEKLKPDIQVINEPAYTGGNAPDFLFKKGEVPIAYAECKDVDVDISRKDVKKQANRYVGAFGRILLTNYLDFEIISEEGELVSISIAKMIDHSINPIEENFESFANLVCDYITPSHRTIRSAKKLATIMAHKAQILRANARVALKENQQSDIYAQYNTFKEVLIHDLSEQDFADMYAQTLVYGLFVARYYDPTIKTFSRHEAQDLLPASNPLLKKFFGHVAGINYDPKIAWLVDSLVEAYLSTDVHELMHKEFVNKQKDPVLHFYETFLTEYDKDLRKSRGVYYTPEPVVSFIVRSVDQILKSKFNLPKGLADTSTIDHKIELQKDTKKKKYMTKQIHKVQVLDPAVGTGTFLNEVIYEIHKSFKGQEGSWPSYVSSHLLPRLHGFELMMASYTMAHLKLGVTLKELGYEGDDRLSVWLTNSLEESVHEVPNLFMSQWLTEESHEASWIKSKLPIMVVLGNPPYSGESFNKNYSGHDVYKVEPGGTQKLQERNSKWINDDYVKFIRFAENQIAKTGEGIVSFITPHGYLDNPTFRGMRWHLMKTFDEIYVLDLHGNANKKETTPDGGKDENVFGIKTGTAIIFAIKKNNDINKLAKLWHADFYGKQREKYQKLNENSWKQIKWKKLEPREPELYFIPFDNEVKGKYDEGFSIKKLFPLSSIGIQSHRDDLVIDFSKKQLCEKLSDVFANSDSLSVLQKYNIKNTDSWCLSVAVETEGAFEFSKITNITYRPFDTREIFYSNNFVDRTRLKTGKHIKKENLVLNFPKLVKVDWNHCLITDSIPTAISLDINGSYFAPLYLYHDDGTRTPNLDKEIWKKIDEIIGKTEPENILDYIYAVLYSPNYREKYKEFLKIDFPRVPYPKDKKTFSKLIELGRELRELHLLGSLKVNDFSTTYSISGTNMVEKKYPKYDNGKVYINDAQYFGNVPEVAWDFYIGGYQPAQKWLKDRRERELSVEDIEHYQKMIVALSETDTIMKEVDKSIKL
ncbi:N-6 DNA methylase [Candidatus Peregrinibacteria bacterium]|jgi:predicted helicase|nr:N-6 DNA methylase [Candidatus Peregrinibacteria bacterium]